MTSNVHEGDRIRGTLGSADGTGVVRIEARLAAGIDDVWSALADAGRLAHWYGEVEGDLRLGGAFSARLFASGWEGKVRVEECEPPRRFVIVSKAPDEPNEDSSEVTLTPDGDQTILVFEQRGVPLDLVHAYGAGAQIHVEDLASYLVGGDRCDAKARFEELLPAYQELAAAVG